MNSQGVFPKNASIPTPPPTLPSGILAQYMATNAKQAAVFRGGQYGTITDRTYFNTLSGNKITRFTFDFTPDSVTGLNSIMTVNGDSSSSKYSLDVIQSDKKISVNAATAGASYVLTQVHTTNDVASLGVRYTCEITVDPSQTGAAKFTVKINGASQALTLDNELGGGFVGFATTTAAIKIGCYSDSLLYPLTGKIHSLKMESVTDATSCTYDFTSGYGYYPTEYPAANQIVWSDSIVGVYEYTDLSGNGHHMTNQILLAGTTPYVSMPIILKNKFGNNFPCLKFTKASDTFLANDFGFAQAAHTIVHFLKHTYDGLQNVLGSFEGFISDGAGPIPYSNLGSTFIVTKQSNWYGLSFGNTVSASINLTAMVSHGATIIGVTDFGNGSQPLFYQNGGQTFPSSPDATNRLPLRGIILGRPGAAYVSHDLGTDFEHYGTLVFSRALGQAEMQQVSEWFAYACGAKNNVIMSGNSISEGNLASRISLTMAGQLAVAVNNNKTIWSNFAQPGITTANLASQQANRENKAGISRCRNVVRMWEGRNAMSPGVGTSPSVDYGTNLAGYFSSIKAAIPGIKTFTSTIPPDQSAGKMSEANRTTFNGLVIANSIGVDVVDNETADPYIGVAAAAFNTAYFPDNLHLSDAGFAVKASYEAPGVSSLLIP